MKWTVPRLSYKLPPTIAQIPKSGRPGQEISVTGFIRSVRRQKRVSFAVISDGSNASGLQAVFANSSLVDNLTNGASARFSGKLVESPGKKQDLELAVDQVEVLGACDAATYPIQKQTLSVEHLRNNLHLRSRTTRTGAMLRMRSQLMKSMFLYFDSQGFQFTHTPILTSNDAEGAGETFSIADDPEEPFFGRPAHLTVSAQLHLEALMAGLSRVYTLSPCFRAEHSQTNRHLAEFWMLEAEWIDASREGVQGLCSLVEDSLKALAADIVAGEPFSALWDTHKDDTRRQAILACLDAAPWRRMTYSDAVEHLIASGVQFEHTPTWGSGLQSEHEKWLAEQFVAGPVFVTDYPKSLKPFYMMENDDGKTVACFDLLVPHVGELVGGSVREARPDVLKAKMEAAGVSGKEYEWYQQLREFGGAPHVGYGMGFERLVSWLSGIENVRECVAMPRWSGKMLL
ncbi:asparaginyl-tRNA synthetase [Cylindrobasidium torrendii FP15055 ss-10]|uniref:asparagine--tRNA ligase n=1 Tax=Cylindrobasidium torrendii FP15055 ss-10 TaxID=1314674 RepID=A0A0D7BHE3_9AGAR|nr:asparaginyl-tRNA synthetase [Cylindrobasidium torrendii FP15055 ss-10]